MCLRENPMNKTILNRTIETICWDYARTNLIFINSQAPIKNSSRKVLANILIELVFIAEL